jgi:nucleoside-diphosphate-sugar epimerase
VEDTVRACVRDASREDRTAHLLAMNGRGVGKVELAEADLLDDGAYDDIFRGCSAVFHVAANFGTDPRWAAATSVIGRLSPVDEVVAKDKEEPTTSYDQGVYDSLVVATERVLASIEKSGGSVKRLIYTSSYAAIGGPGSYADGHQISEADWAGAGSYISEEHMMEKHKGCERAASFFVLLAFLV